MYFIQVSYTDPLAYDTVKKGCCSRDGHCPLAAHQQVICLMLAANSCDANHTALESALQAICLRGLDGENMGRQILPGAISGRDLTPIRSIVSLRNQLKTSMMMAFSKINPYPS